MISLSKYSASDKLTYLYVFTVLLFAIFSLASFQAAVQVMKFLTIPILFLLYAFSARPLLLNYVFALIALYISNCLMNFQSELSVFVSLIFYTIFRIFVVIIIFKNIKKIRALAWLLHIIAEK